MEADRIELSDPQLLLDVLKAAQTDALALKVGVHDGPWKVVALGIRHALIEHRRAHGEIDAASEPACLWHPSEVTETALRQVVVDTYMKKSSLDAVVKAKLEDELSFFHTAGSYTLELVKQHWNWYLYCLTLEDSCFKSIRPIFYHAELVGLKDITGKLVQLLIKQSLRIEDRADFIASFSIGFQVIFMPRDSHSFHLTSTKNCVLFQCGQGSIPYLEIVLDTSESTDNYAGRLVVRLQTRSGYGPSMRREPSFTCHDSIISQGGDLLRETMTILDAKKKAASLGNCKGFCFRKPQAADNRLLTARMCPNSRAQSIRVVFEDSSSGSECKSIAVFPTWQR